MKRPGTLSGAVRVGLKWGSIGGVAGFLVSLLGAFSGVVAAVFVGIACGRRAVRDSSGSERSTEDGAEGAVAGLVGGAVAAPVFVLGAAAGALVAIRNVGTDRLASMLGQIMGMPVSSEEAWRMYLIGLAFAAALQMAVLVTSSTIAGAVVARRKA